jgi:hypothetical protein
MADFNNLTMNLCLATLLWAIAAVETGHDDAAIGSVWRQHEPHLPHDQCHGQAATHVATQHLHWLVKQVGLDVTSLASSWNQGATGHKRRGPNDYAQRVSNLYSSKKATPTINAPSNSDR